MLCLLGPEGLTDPSYQAHASPILVWARSAWLRRMTPAELTEIAEWAMARCAEQAEPWRHASGPGQA